MTEHYLYFDELSGTQKGPIPATVLERLVEKGVGVTPETLIWTNGMLEWRKLQEVEQFGRILRFLQSNWYFLDHEGLQIGPISTRQLLHKIKESQIDGLTLIKPKLDDPWRKLSEIEILKEKAAKIACEEDNAESLLKQNQEETQNQIFVSDEGELVERSRLFQTLQLSATTKSMRDGESKTVEKRSFVADDGVRYCWDEQEGDWVEDSDQEVEPESNGPEEDTEIEQESGSKEAPVSSSEEKQTKRKRKSRKKQGHWVFVSGLPADVSVEEIRDHFSKVGLLSVNPLDQQPRIKIYPLATPSSLTREALLCYHSPESLVLCLDILHEGHIRPAFQIHVSKADFSNIAEKRKIEGKGLERAAYKPKVSKAQYKVAKKQLEQALAWNEDDDSGVRKDQALRIVVIEGLFHPSELVEAEGGEDVFLKELEEDLVSECLKFGPIEKITVFSKNPRGIVIVKFKTSFAAQLCVKTMEGRYFGGRKLKIFFWDGSTDYSVSLSSSNSSLNREENVSTDSDQEDSEEEGQHISGKKQNLLGEEIEEEKRLSRFGDWLDKEQEDLPEEFQLRVEK